MFRLRAGIYRVFNFSVTVGVGSGFGVVKSQAEVSHAQISCDRAGSACGRNLFENSVGSYFAYLVFV